MVVVPLIGLWSEWNGILSRRHATDGCSLALTLTVWTVCLEKNRPSLQIVCQTCPFTSVPDVPGFQWWKILKKPVNGSLFYVFSPRLQFQTKLATWLPSWFRWRAMYTQNLGREPLSFQTLRNMSTLYTTVTLKSWSQSLREKGPLRPFWFILLDAPLASKIGTWDRSFYKASILLQFRQCSEVCPKHASQQFPTCIELLLLLSFPSDQLALSRHTEVTAACLASCLYKFTRAFIWCNDCSGCF